MQLKSKLRRHFNSRRKIELVVDETYYGKIEEGNYRCRNPTVGRVGG
jgi:hypothetical protein